LAVSEIFNHADTCDMLLSVTPLVCSSYSSLALSSPFISWWQKDCELFTHTLVPSLQCSPSTSSRHSRALLHNLQFTSDRCLNFASHLATGMILAIAVISRLLCLQGTRGPFKYFPKNALLSFCRNMKSAVHVPYAGWFIALLCPSSHSWFQEFSVINPSVLLQDLHHKIRPNVQKSTKLF